MAEAQHGGLLPSMQTHQTSNHPAGLSIEISHGTSVNLSDRRGFSSRLLVPWKVHHNDEDSATFHSHSIKVHKTSGFKLLSLDKVMNEF